MPHLYELHRDQSANCDLCLDTHVVPCECIGYKRPKTRNLSRILLWIVSATLVFIATCDLTGYRNPLEWMMLLSSALALLVLSSQIGPK